MTTHLHQTLALSGIFELLQDLDRLGSVTINQEQILAIMTERGVEDPLYAFKELLGSRIIVPIGVDFSLSRFGIRASILLDALNGGDLRIAYDRLRRIDRGLVAYELVREGMTDSFLENLNDRPGFARVYLCSPWINFSRRNAELLTHAVHLAERRTPAPEVFVITRPDSDGNVPSAVSQLSELQPRVFLNSRLHTKLYIREPGPEGGYTMAVVGSQNLTRSSYLELGIRVNSDTAMVNQLVAYFWELAHGSSEAGG